MKKSNMINMVYEPFSDTVNTVLNRVKSAQQDGIDGISTGFEDIDRRIGGLQAGELIVIGGRPSMGKTTFALEILRHTAITNNIPVAYFTFGNSREQITKRLIAMDAHVDLNIGKLSEADMEIVHESAKSISNAPILIYDCGCFDLKTIRNHYYEWNQGYDIGLIIIEDEFLAMLKTKKPSQHRGFMLKTIAKELGIPIIVSLKTPRKVDKRKGHRPLIHDFVKNDGDIIQCTGVAMFLYRDEYYYLDSEKPGIMEVMIAMNRNGLCGTVELAFLRWKNGVSTLATLRK